MGRSARLRQPSFRRQAASPPASPSVMERPVRSRASSSTTARAISQQRQSWMASTASGPQATHLSGACPSPAPQHGSRPVTASRRAALTGPTTLRTSSTSAAVCVPWLRLARWTVTRWCGRRRRPSPVTPRSGGAPRPDPRADRQQHADGGALALRDSGIAVGSESVTTNGPTRETGAVDELGDDRSLGDVRVARGLVDPRVAADLRDEIWGWLEARWGVVRTDRETWPRGTCPSCFHHLSGAMEGSDRPPLLPLQDGAGGSQVRARRQVCRSRVSGFHVGVCLGDVVEAVGAVDRDDGVAGGDGVEE